jgi:hypothetical protein
VKVGWMTVSRFVAKEILIEDRKVPAKIMTKRRGKTSFTAYRAKQNPIESFDDSLAVMSLGTCKSKIAQEGSVRKQSEIHQDGVDSEGGSISVMI